MYIIEYIFGIYLSKRKRLYGCFVEDNMAFDTVITSTLWIKVLLSGISERILNVIKT